MHSCAFRMYELFFSCFYFSFHLIVVTLVLTLMLSLSLKYYIRILCKEYIALGSNLKNNNQKRKI